MHLQNAGQDNGSSASAIWQVWLGVGRFRLNLVGSFNFTVQFIINLGRDQQRIPRTVANADH
jgi:hypothetical protein